MNRDDLESKKSTLLDEKNKIELELKDVEDGLRNERLQTALKIISELWKDNYGSVHDIIKDMVKLQKTYDLLYSPRYQKAFNKTIDRDDLDIKIGDSKETLIDEVYSIRKRIQNELDAKRKEIINIMAKNLTEVLFCYGLNKEEVPSAIIGYLRIISGESPDIFGYDTGVEGVIKEE